ncbi:MULTISPECIES: YbjQ family protein [unclassified Moraxella]|uniref:YbjQ family protein n=1 Tax=unclassified Moraxella TaxID=2685852 RepID=UPI00359D9BB9
MQLSNLEHLPNHTITERLDVVYGSTVRTKHVGKDFLAGLKNIIGGELVAYTELLEEARQEALGRMIAKAVELGADAIVGVRFATSNVAAGASEIFVYGTAVKAIREPFVQTTAQAIPQQDLQSNQASTMSLFE